MIINTLQYVYFYYYYQINYLVSICKGIQVNIKFENWNICQRIYNRIENFKMGMSNYAFWPYYCNWIQLEEPD